MAKIIRELIEYSGIENNCHKLNLFNQDSYNFTLYINDENPACEEIEKVWISYSIVHTENIKTHKGISLEGVQLTGKALLIIGDFKVKIQYIGSGSTQKAYTVESLVPFSGVVTLPKDYNENEYLMPTVVIEDINSTKIEPKAIYNSITLTFSVTKY
ncbi:MAG: SPOCS domain-containing protein [Clostridium sp.]